MAGEELRLCFYLLFFLLSFYVNRVACQYDDNADLLWPNEDQIFSFELPKVMQLF